MKDYLVDQEVNDRVGLARFKRRLELHLEPYFRGRRMTGIETADVRLYTLKRRRISETVAMKLSGHKTMSVFRR